MPSDNMSRPTSDAYREGWERTFGKPYSAEPAVSIISDKSGDLVVSARGETYTISRKDAEAMAVEELAAQRRAMMRALTGLDDEEYQGGEP